MQCSTVPSPAPTPLPTLNSLGAAHHTDGRVSGVARPTDRFLGPDHMLTLLASKASQAEQPGEQIPSDKADRAILQARGGGMHKGLMEREGQQGRAGASNGDLHIKRSFI